MNWRRCACRWVPCAPRGAGWRPPPCGPAAGQDRTRRRQLPHRRPVPALSRFTAGALTRGAAVTAQPPDLGGFNPRRGRTLLAIARQRSPDRQGAGRGGRAVKPGNGGPVPGMGDALALIPYSATSAAAPGWLPRAGQAPIPGARAARCGWPVCHRRHDLITSGPATTVVQHERTQEFNHQPDPQEPLPKRVFPKGSVSGTRALPRARHPCSRWRLPPTRPPTVPPGVSRRGLDGGSCVA